jgi:DNA polymerase-3 subunit epsilon
LARLDGTVIVAHNAAFEERFIVAEFARAGVKTPPMPALCSLWLGQQTFDTPNHKLGTLAQHAGMPLVDAHAALGDVRATAALLPLMLDRYRPGIEFGHDPARGLFDPYRLGAVTPVTRASSLRKGTDGWMHSLMSTCPSTQATSATPQPVSILKNLPSPWKTAKSSVGQSPGQSRRSRRHGCRTSARPQ